MNAYLASSPRAYREAAVLTATGEQLIVMLYDGARRFLYQAGVAMADKNIELSHNKLRRAELIVVHLRDTLDLEQGGELALRLRSIYLFCERHMQQARFERDPSKLEEVSQLLGQLREAWAEIAGANER
jgi:flagellar protein FliS